MFARFKKYPLAFESLARQEKMLTLKMRKDPFHEFLKHLVCRLEKRVRKLKAIKRAEEKRLKRKHFYEFQIKMDKRIKGVSPKPVPAFFYETAK